MKKLFLPLLVIILAFPAIIALFHAGFFLTDDGNSMIIRFSAFYDAFRHGQFPVRFLPRLNYEYGYPVADFLYPLFLYIGIPIKLLGFTFVNTIKIILGMSLLLSGLCSFFWLKKLFKNPSAFAGAIVYALFPYHLWDMYKRGSVGEAVGLAIVPFVLWQVERRSIALAGMGLALLILAHNVLALLFFPIILIYLFLSKKFSIRNAVMVLVLGIGIPAFFWIPAITDKRFTIFDTTIVSDFAKYFLLLPDYSLIGLIALCAIGLSIYGLWIKKKAFFWFFWIVTIVSIFLSLPVSEVVWRYIPGTYFIQFPFRLLSLTTLGVSFLVAVSIEEISEKYYWYIAISFIFLAYFSSANLFTPKGFQEYPDTFYSTNVDSTTVKGEYMPVWVKTSPNTIPGEKVFVVSGSGIIQNVFANGDGVGFNAVVQNAGVVQVNTVYFPGWKAIVDGKEQQILYDNTYGAIQIPLSAGAHIVRIKFSETPERLISDIISLISLAAAMYVFILERKNHAVE